MNTAMILAAGRGERFKPFTDHQPKALCQLRGKALLSHHLDNLLIAGFTRVVINHAHLGYQLRHHLRRLSLEGLEVLFSAEPPGALETGGGILQALPLLGKEPFVTLNGDVYSDYDLSLLTLSPKHLAHYVMVPKPPYASTGDFEVRDRTLITSEQPPYTLSGISCYHPDFFADCKPGRYSVVPKVRQLIPEGRIGAEVYEGIWFDIGSASRKARAEEALS